MVSSGPRANLSLEAGAARGLSIGSAPGETHRWTTHVVIHVRFAEDVGSTPTASTTLNIAEKWCPEQRSEAPCDGLGPFPACHAVLVAGR